jgi:opacity protein-like surface antigen
MKTLVAAAILAMAIASPALAQRAPQQGYQSERNGYYHGYPLQDWYRDDSY